MAASPFIDWLPEVATDEIVVEPSNFVAEARGNLWSFAITSARAATLDPAHVASFVRAVAAACGRQLAARGMTAMLFYCWHDVPAAQPRFSLVAADYGRPPFACSIEPTADLGSIAASFLESPYHDGIPPAGGPLDENDTDSALPVWIVSLPECNAHRCDPADPSAAGR